jgi:purine-binding chemotaxis protein CheW
MTPMEPFILFELAGTTYGVRSRFVQQIEMIDDVASVPNAHPAVEGVVLVRDLRSLLVFINTGSRTVGLVVDTAREFLKIAAESIEPPPEALTGLSGHYLEGVATIGERMILILNLDAVLDLEYEVEPQISL